MDHFTVSELTGKRREDFDTVYRVSSRIFSEGGGGPTG